MSYRKTTSHGPVNYTVQRGLNFKSVNEPLVCDHSKKSAQQYFHGLFISVLQIIFQYFSFELGHSMEPNGKDCLEKTYMYMQVNKVRF